ncbi:hypothetical protein BDV23DRAFT_196003, partial [Aspergillus alliaceus]
ERCTQTKIANIYIRFEIQTNRILYPFRRETLMSLMETLSWLQANLNTSLQMLTISMVATSQRQIDLIVTNSKSSLSDTSQMLDVANRMNQSSISIDGRLDMLEQHINQVELNIRRTQARSVPTIASLSSISDIQRGDDDNVGSLTISRYRKYRNRCMCSHHNQSQLSGWGDLEARHEYVCPFHRQDKRIFSIFKRWVFCNRILKLSIRASITVQMGAGGFFISPKIHFRPIVSAESPVFCLLRETEKCLKSEMIGPEIEGAQKKLLALFAEGKGAPLDTLPNGDTILHMIAGWQKYSHQWDSNSWLIWRAFINVILQQGLLPDRVNDQGETPADIMIQYYRSRHQEQPTLDICSDLLNAGGHMTHQALDWRHHPNVFNPCYYMTRFDGRQDDTMWDDYSIQLVWTLRDKKEIQDIDLPEELLPLIHRSRDQLMSAVQKGINLQTWVASYTQWPSGLALLLQHDHTSTEGCLQRACEVNCEESVKLLLNASGYCIGPSVLETASKHNNPAIMKLVVQALASRRKRLQLLAERYLPDEVVSQLGIQSDYLLDIQAHRVYQLLKEKFINVENLEERYEWSVYDHIGINMKLADLLWDIGFRHLDEDKQNTTCLMKLWWSSPPCSFNTFLGKANWFIAKGADLNRQKLGSSATALHILGKDMGKMLHSMESVANVALEMTKLNKTSKDLMCEVLADNIHDDCYCPCSLDGCSGITRLLHGLFRQWPERDIEELLQRLVIMLEILIPLLEPAVQERLVPCVLRFISCQRLEITHTCVHGTFGEKEIPTEEISEIHDEERESILELEQLVVELPSERPTPLFPASLVPWWMHINEVLASRRAPNKEEINKVLETGVVLYG